MTELEKMLPPLEPEKIAPTEPEFESFSNWQTNNTSGDLIQDRVDWGNYVREKYLESGLYDESIAKEINDTTEARLKEAQDSGLIGADVKVDAASLFTTPDTDLDTKLKSIQSTFDYNTSEWESATKYLAFKEVNPDDTALDEVQKQRGEELRTQAESIADRYYDDAKKRMVLNGELPIAKFTDEDGKTDYIIGRSFDKNNVVDAIRNSKKGDISFADADKILAKTRIPTGYKEEAYKIERYIGAMGAIEGIWGGLSNSMMDRYGDALAEADKEGRELNDLQKPDFSSIRREVNKTLPENEGFTDEEIEKAFTQSAYMRANANGKFKLYDDTEELYKNIRNVGFANPLVNPSIMANEEKLKLAIEGNSQLTQDDRNYIMETRTPFLQAHFDKYNQLLSRSEDTSEKWLNTLQAGRASGKKDYEILGEYASNPDNFNEMSARLSGIGESILDGFGELVAAVPMMAGADWARDYMIGNIKERSDRREVARLFGTEFGVGQDFMESVAPMLVDVGATALLSTLTAPAAGAGGAAYASAKAGARLTAKGLVKSLTTSALRQLPTETAEQASKRLLAEGLIKQSTQEAGTKGAMAAIKAYNSSLASKIGSTAAMALPAYNRSAGATYAAVYSQLQQDGKLTPEQIHDRALGAGLTSGAITAAITAGFGALGRGALEDALLGGASKKQIKNILTKLSKVDDISDVEFTTVTAKSVSDVMKRFGTANFGKEIARNAFDEGAEEALDDFVNGFVFDAATDQDTPFLERLESAGRSALIGAGMGGAAVPAIKAAKDLVSRQSTADQRRSIELSYAQDISNRLAQTSPISAQTVLTILKAPRVGRDAYAQAKLEAARATLNPPQVPVKPEGTTVKDEAGVDEVEPSPNVLTPQNLTNVGKEPEVVYLPDEVVAGQKPEPAQQATKEGEIIDVETVQPEIPLLETQEEITVEEPTEAERPISETLPKANPERVKLINERLANVTPEEIEQAIKEEMVTVAEEGPQSIKALPAPIIRGEVEIEEEPTIIAEAAAPAAPTTKTKGKGKVKALIEKTPVAVATESSVVTTPQPIDNSTDTPEDALAFTRNDEARINAQAEALGIDKEEVTKHVRNTFNNMLLISEQVDEPVITQVKEKPVDKKAKVKAPVAVTEAPVAEVPKQKSVIEKAVGVVREEVIERMAKAGALVRFRRNAQYGMPKGFDSDITQSDISDDLAKRVYKSYKPLSTNEVSEMYQIPVGLFKGGQTKPTSWWNPFKQQFVQDEKIKFNIVIDGGVKTGLFDNNPFTVASMLKRKLPVYIPSTFNGVKNPAIKADKITGVVWDVRFPDPNDPNVEISIVHTNESPKQKPEVAETVSKQLEFLNGLKPPIDATLEVNRDLQNLGDLSPKEGSPDTTYYKALDSFNQFIDSVYSNVAGSVRAKKAVGQSNALLKLFGFSDKGKGLDRSQVQTANETAIMELVPEFHQTLFRGELYQTLQKNNAIVYDGEKQRNKYTIDPRSTEASRSILLDRIKVPQDFTLPASIKDKSTKEVQAYFLLTTAFKKAQVLPKIGEEVITENDINPDSANTIIDQFLFNSINDETSRPDSKGLFPNVGAVVKRVSNRVMDRIKYQRDTASKNDFYDAAFRFEGELSEISRLELDAALAEIFGDSSVETIHSSTDALKAENVFRGVRKEAEQLLRTDPQVAKAIKLLAKQTVYANDPDIADNKFPVDVFRDIALWASPTINKQTAADSFRFRRQLLDYFPVATANSTLVHDAFEASGAFAHDFKRVADKGTIDLLIRNGFTRAEAESVLERRNIKRVVEETGVSEQEAFSIIESQRKIQNSYSAPSLISGKHREFYRRLNQREIDRLGLESGNTQSVYDALRMISIKGITKQNRAVAKLLLRFPSVIRNTQFAITDIKINRAGNFSLGMNGVNRVTLNKSGFYGVGVESVLLHEYVHAITMDVLTRPETSLTPAQRSAKTRLKGLLQLATKQYNAELQKTGVGSMEFELSTTNLEEFVASFFSSPEFQNKVKVLQQTEIKSRSFFARIYDAILDIFGIKPKSDIDKAFADLVDLTSVGNVDGQRTIESQVDRSMVENRNNGGSRRIVPVKSNRQEARMSSFEPIDSIGAATTEQQATIDRMIDQAIASLVPANVRVTVFDTQEEADSNGIFGDRPDAAVVATLMRDSTGQSVPAIFVNRANMRAALLSRNSNIENPLMAKGILESIFNEELFHIAEFYAFTTEEIGVLADSMSDVDFDGIIDNYTPVLARREQLKRALRGENSAEVKNQLVGEMLRMKAQMVTRGFTSESDIAFYESNPNLMSIAFRYLRGFFRRMYARYNLNKNDPELAAAIHHMSVELRFLQEGTYNVDTHSPFDPNNVDENIELLRQRFSATAAEITEDTPDDEVERRFKALFDSLELPVALYKNGKYEHMSTKWQQWIKGDVDPRISRLHKQQKFFEQATDILGKSMMSKIHRLIKETYGDSGIDPSLLSAATGTTEFIRIDKDIKKKIQQDYRDAVRERKAGVKRGEIDPKWIDSDSLAAMYKAMVTDLINGETDRLREEVRLRQTKALDQISKDSPQLAAALVEMRKVTDALSKQVKKKYNLSESMQVKFDANMGIYLTRAYKAFNEEGYIERVLESKDQKFVEIRQEASQYFRDRYIKQLANSKHRVSINNSKITGGSAITKQQAIELATNEVDSNPSIVAQFMAQFLRSYAPDYMSRAGTLPKGVTKSLINNLRRKSNLDPAVRKLLGEYDQETEGVNNLLRTYSVVSTMVARQSFYNNIIEMAKSQPVIGADGNPLLDAEGEPVLDGFLLTEDDLREKLKKNPMMQQEYVNIRTGKVYTPDTKEQIPSGLAGQYDPTYNYYGPKEMVEGMRRMYTPPVLDENLTGAQRAVSGITNMFNTLTGLSLAIKTLGSVPFYLRNIASNMFFFAPAQGLSFNAYGKMLKNSKHILQKGQRPEEIDAYQAELISLGVLNNEMTSSLIKDMLSDNFKMERINEEIDTLTGKIKLAAVKGSEFVKPLTDRLQALSQAVDGFYKMSYYEHEREKLIEAKEADIREGNLNSFYAKLSDYEIKREAARKLLATAQSYSESPPIVQETVKNVGMFVAPFLRFKTEAPRIVFNTYKEAMAEIKSGNSVMVARGWKRFSGMTGMLGIFSIAVPTAVRLFLGIGEDEDEALRDTVPLYMRDNTFFYYTSGDKLKSVDLTFLNPFSMLADPVLRAGEHIWRLDPESAFVSFTNAFMNQYLDAQIFTGTLIDVYANKDSSTGEDIYLKSDKAQIFSKSLFYIGVNAFAPRTLEKAVAAVNSARGTAVDSKHDFLNIVMGEFKPFKVHDVDVTAQATKLLGDKRTERTTLSSRKNKLKTKKAVTDNDIRDMAKEFVDSRIRIEEELYRGLRGFSGLPAAGLSERDLVNLMRDKSINMGDRRIMLLQNKMVEKPVLDPPFIQDVLKLGDEGARRLNIFQTEVNRLFPARFMPLNS
jgi:hypothetical protein